MCLWLAWMLSISGCATAGNKYFCPVEAAYDATGKMDSTSYRVKADCYQSMTKKQKACYQLAEKAP